MIKPPALDSEDGDMVWHALTASEAGDVDALRHLIPQVPRLGPRGILRQHGAR